jgi:hypothetical protein
MNSRDKEMVERTKRHVKVESFKAKDGRHIGVCVAAVLDYFGIPNKTYIYTALKGNRKLYENILEENGYVLYKDTRLRGLSVAMGLKRFKYLGYYGGDKIIIIASNKSSAHMLLVTSNGYRIIDTAPRRRLKIEEIIKVRKIIA